MPQSDSVNVLLVDDHGPNLLALDAVLADLGLNLLKARSGPAALACLLRDVRPTHRSVCSRGRRGRIPKPWSASCAICPHSPIR